MTTAIIGCGVIAASHVRILRRLKPEARIAVCDVDEQKARAFASQWNITAVYTDVARMLEEEKPAAVHVVTPPHLHARLAEQALNAGAHAFVEKPVTENAEDYRRIADLAASTNRVLCGDYSTLGMPVVMQALGLVHSGSMGRLVSVHCTFAGSEGGGRIQYKDPHHWAYRLRGGIVQNMIDHPLSLVLSAMDDITDHHVHISRRNILPHDSPDLVHLSLGSEDQMGSLTLSLGHGANDRRAQFVLEGGTIMIDMGRQLISVTRGRGPQSFVKKALSGIQDGYAYGGGTVKNMVLGVAGKLQRDPGIVNVMANFYDAVERGTPLMVTHKMLSTLTRILDSIWAQLEEQPAQQANEVSA